MGGRGCLVRGIPRCCSPSAPGKEREKEGEFFFFPDWLKMDTNVLVWYAGVEVFVCQCVYKERMWKRGRILRIAVTSVTPRLNGVEL